LKQRLPVRKTLILSAIRFGILTILAFILLGIRIVVQKNMIVRPTVQLFFDNSESIKLADEYAIGVYRKIDSLCKRFPNIHFAYFAFDKQVTPLTGISDIHLNGKETNMEKIFQSGTFSGSYHTVIVTDGNWNSGRDPLYYKSVATNLHFFPVGEPQISYDIGLIPEQQPATVFAQRKYTMRILLERNQTVRDESVVKIFKNQKLIRELKQKWNESELQKSLNIPLTFSSEGRYQIRMEVRSGQKEKILWNNVYRTRIKVLPDKYKILFVGGVPDADIRMWKLFFQGDSLFKFHFSVDVIKNSGPLPDSKKYDAMIFWKFPSNASKPSLIDQYLKMMREQRLPVWINIVPSNTDFWRQQLNFPKTFMSNRMLYFHSTIPTEHPLQFIYNQPEKNSEYWQQNVVIQAYPFYGTIQNFTPVVKGMWEGKNLPVAGIMKIRKRVYFLTAFDNIWRWYFYNVSQEKYGNALKLWFRNVLLYLIRMKDYHPLWLEIPEERMVVNVSQPIQVRVMDMEGKPIEGVLLKLKVIKNHEVMFYQEKIYPGKDEEAASFYFHPPDSGVYQVAVEAISDGKTIDRKKEAIFVSAADIEKASPGLNQPELRRLANGLNGDIFQDFNSFTDWLGRISKMSVLKKKTSVIWKISYQYMWLMVIVLLFSIEWTLRRLWNEL
jgi:hypothetical protein